MHLKRRFHWLLERSTKSFTHYGGTTAQQNKKSRQTGSNVDGQRVISQNHFQNLQRILRSVAFRIRLQTADQKFPYDDKVLLAFFPTVNSVTKSLVRSHSHKIEFSRMITLADKRQWHANASQTKHARQNCLVEIQDYVYFISRLTCFTRNDTRARTAKLRENFFQKRFLIF